LDANAKPVLVIDVREAKLIAALTAIGVPFTTEALDIGDILIQDVTGPLLVAERKTHADFAASNTDGRYREQRGRLMSLRTAGAGVGVMYFLEGSWTGSVGTTDEATLRRLTTRLMLRYGLPVLFTTSVADTAQWCRVLLAQLTDDHTVFRGDATAMTSAMTSFSSALNTVKKGNRTAEGTASAMLSAIPGLGAKRIQSVLETVSIADLVGMSVADIAKLSAGGKCLGPKLAETLYAALHTRLEGQKS
jgi:ERCC4-type nuclease